MKAPVVLVAAALAVAILLAASFLIATGTRGENALRPPFDSPVGRSLPAADDNAAARANSISFDSKNRKASPVRLAAY
jgi:hypothetical protein